MLAGRMSQPCHVPSSKSFLHPHKCSSLRRMRGRSVVEKRREGRVGREKG